VATGFSVKNREFGAAMDADRQNLYFRRVIWDLRVLAGGQRE